MTTDPLKKRRRIVQFSLRTMLLLVLLITSGIGLWWRWEPWVLEKEFPNPTQSVSQISFILKNEWLVYYMLGEAEIWQVDSTIKKIPLNGTPSIDIDKMLNTKQSFLLLLNKKNDNDLNVIDLKTNTPVKTLRGHPGTIYYFCYSKDKSLIATGAADKTARVWNAATGKCISIIKDLSSAVIRVAFIPQSTNLLVCTHKGELIIWDFNMNKRIHTLYGHSVLSADVAIGPLGRNMLVTDLNSLIIFWDLEKGIQKEFFTPILDDVNFGFEFSNNGKFVLVPYGNGLTLWSVQKEKIQTTLAECISGSFSPSGDRVLSVNFDDTLSLWDPESGAKLCNFGLPRLGPEYLESPCANFNLRGDRIVAACLKKVLFFRRRRPEWWWGIAWLPESWLILIFGVALAWSLRSKWKNGLKKSTH